MNPQPTDKPTGEPSKGEGRSIDLEAAYRVLIRAYLRRRMMPPRESGVKHG